MTTTARPFLAVKKRIADLVIKYGLPAIYFDNEFVDEGGLMSYGADYEDMFRKSAHYVDKILKGTNLLNCPLSNRRS